LFARRDPPLQDRPDTWIDYFAGFGMRRKLAGGAAAQSSG
jgi:hypothetical protein